MNRIRKLLTITLLVLLSSCNKYLGTISTFQGLPVKGAVVMDLDKGSVTKTDRYGRFYLRNKKDSIDVKIILDSVAWKRSIKKREIRHFLLYGI